MTALANLYKPQPSFSLLFSFAQDQSPSSAIQRGWTRVGCQISSADVIMTLSQRALCPVLRSKATDIREVDRLPQGLVNSFMGPGEV